MHMKKDKKICICAVQVPFVRGGAEIHVEGLRDQMVLRGYPVELVTVPFKWYPPYEAVNAALTWRLIDLESADGQKIDLVIATKYPSYAVNHSNKVTWLIQQFRQAYDLYEEAHLGGLKSQPDGETARDLITEIDNTLLPESKNIFGNSKNVSGRLKRYNNIESTPLYHPPKAAERYFAGSYGDYILSVGRLNSIKRLDLLLQALCYCDKSIKAVIAGTGSELENLKALAKQLKVSDRVKFMGYVSDEEVFKLYANAFAVYFAPVDEDYGYITLESFLAKKPVITCIDSGGVLEFAEHGRNSFISKPVAEAVGENINKLYANKKLCIEFGKEGYDRVKDITWDNVIEKLTQTL